MSFGKRWNECPKFKQSSETNKRSRAVATELGTPPYVGGSISMSAHKKKLRDEPTPKETFIKCYTKNDGTCVGKKADETMENFDKLLDQAAIAEGEDLVDLDLLWVDSAGGAKKGWDLRLLCPESSTNSSRQC